jgi:hypothetical protein
MTNQVSFCWNARGVDSADLQRGAPRWNGERAAGRPPSVYMIDALARGHGHGARFYHARKTIAFLCIAGMDQLIACTISPIDAALAA